MERWGGRELERWGLARIWYSTIEKQEQGGTSRGTGRSPFEVRFYILNIYFTSE